MLEPPPFRACWRLAPRLFLPPYWALRRWTPMVPSMYIFLMIEAVLVNHQSGSCGCLCVCVLVLIIGAHGGGWTWSMLSFMYLARRGMNCDAGTSCGVGKFVLFPL